MKKVYIPALLFLNMGSMFAQKVTSDYDFGTSVMNAAPALDATQGILQTTKLSKKEPMNKALNVIWSENFGTTTINGNTLTTAKGSWIQSTKSSQDSSYWSVTNTHPLNYTGSKFNGSYLCWNSFTPIDQYETAKNLTDATTKVNGSVVSPAFDLSGISGNVMLRFNSEGFFCCNASSIPFRISVSEDNGLNWSDTLTVNFGITRNQISTQIANPSEFTFDLSDFTKLRSDKTKLKFIWYDGKVPGPSNQFNSYYYWLIDDIQIYEKPPYDLALEELWLADLKTGFEYTRIPKDFAGKLTVQGKIRKLGSSVPANTKLKVTVTGGNVNTTAEGGVLTNNLTKEFDTITFASNIDLSTFSIGGYTVKSEVLFDQTDEDPSNNSQSRTFAVTNGIYGQWDWERRDRSISAGRPSPDLIKPDTLDSREVGIGNVFYVPQTTDLHGLRLFIMNNPGFYRTTAGAPLDVEFYTFTPTNTNFLIPPTNPTFQDAHTDLQIQRKFEIAPSMVAQTANLVTLNFHQTSSGDKGPVTLEGGKYYVALVKHYGGPGTHFTYLQNNVDHDYSSRVKGGWSCGTTKCTNWFTSQQMFIELVFDKSLSTNELDNDMAIGYIAPNPTSGETSIGFSLKTAQDVTIEVVDLAGKVIYSKSEKGLDAGSHSSTFDASGLTSGVYCVNIKTDSAVSTQKFIKQ